MPAFRPRPATWFGLLLLLPVLAFGVEKAAEPANSRGFEYLALAPPVVVSYGTKGKVGFLKAEVSLRLASAAVPAANQHMPAIRHELIMLLSRQEAESLAAAGQREALRVAALERVRVVLAEAAATRPEDVQDLLFTAFFTQR
jgi:flagellar FliL protein